MTQPDLQALADIEAIRNFKALYGQRVDGLISNFSPEALHLFGQLFTTDAVAEFGLPSGPLAGRGGIMEFIGSRVRAQRSWMWHSFHSPMIEVHGDNAVGRWTIYCLARAKNSSKVDVIVGRYQDEYLRTPEGWRQRRLIFTNESHN